LLSAQSTVADVKLDDDGFNCKIRMKKKPPILGNPLAEGYLSRYDNLSDQWNKVYCILMPDVLYVFQDESRTTIMDIIMLSTFSGSDMHYAAISKYEEKAWDIMNSLQSSMRFFGATNEPVLSKKNTSDSNYGFTDTNQIRIMMLRVAEKMGIFSNMEIPENISIPDLQTLSSDSSPCGSKVLLTLVDLLGAKIGVEQLLEEAANVPVRVAEVVSALLQSDLADSIDKANEICAWLLREKYLIVREPRSRAFDGQLSSTRSSDAEMHEMCDFRNDYFDAKNTSNDAVDSNAAGNDDSVVASSGVYLDESKIDEEVLNLSDPQLHENVRKSVNVLSHEDILASFEGSDLSFNPPNLFPELAAQFDEDNREKDKKIFPKDGNGFVISIDNNTHCFKGSSVMEIIGWIQACRVSIELSWMDYELGKKTKGHYICIDDFLVTVSMRVRCDGPTKVLEISEMDAVDDGTFDQSVGTALVNSSVGVTETSAGSRRMRSYKTRSISNLLKKEMLKSVQKRNSTNVSDSATMVGSSGDDDHPIVYVSFAVPLVAVSLMDFEPIELLYLSLHDIEMTVERSLHTVRFTGTVSEIQISNQLLRPEFPVALFPRRMKGNAGIATGNVDTAGLKTMGFDPNQSYPSLRLQLQQKYHINTNTLAGAFAQESNLHYFDVLSLWIAPFQLDVDEEFLVRCYRFYQAMRSIFSHSEDNLAVSHNKSREVSFEDFLPMNVLLAHLNFLSSNKRPYMDYSIKKKQTSNVYFNLLQLHPIDVVVSFRPSQDLRVSNFEMAFISIISQLDTARLRLNALISENAFGSTSMMTDVLVKHYRASFWNQFHKLIGSSQFVEGSVGLVANLGTGVYDLFYEPIDGLMDANGSFLNGLSKGAVSLSSRAIGGTSAFTSKLAGGLGKGVSLLTLDSQFQRNRTYRRYNKSSTVSEGLYVGTKELGKNIVEGVTGIVVSPYRGWETGGGVGFGMGVAKGLLGVALKPAVGVFDLASRATEGIRNVAFSGGIDEICMDDRYGIHIYRIPRAFGRQKSVQIYDVRAAAAQYIADMLTSFKKEPRLNVVHHMHTVRKIIRTALSDAQFLQSRKVSQHDSNAEALAEEVQCPVLEAWGYPVHGSYIALVCPDRLVLAQIVQPGTDSIFGRRLPNATTWDSSNSSGSSRRVLSVKFIWSCPADCVDQLFSDPRGDLILTINSSLHVTGQWNGSVPVVLDESAQDYLILQSLLEQTIGCKAARLQPLLPTSGFLQTGILKRYSSGFKSLIFMAPTKHSYRVFGNVLYEYSPRRNSPKADTNQSVDSGVDGANNNVTVREQKSAPRNSEEFIHAKILGLFDSPTVTLDSSMDGYSEMMETGQLYADNFLSFIYPLAAIAVTGPFPEDNGKQFSINIMRSDGQKMRVLRREEERDRLSEYHKISLQLLFTSEDDAKYWIELLNVHKMNNPNPADVTPSAALTVEEKKRGSSRMSILNSMAGNSRNINVEASENSILSTLIIPTSGCNPEVTEKIKIEIGKTLSSIRR